MKILACVQYDEQSNSCTAQAWIEQPSFLPTMTAAEGLQISGWFLTIAATAWGFRFLVRYLSPKT